MRKDYDIVGSYDNQRVSSINAERSVNLFEYLDPDGKRPKTLIPTSGLINAQLDFGSVTSAARAAFVFNDAIYQVYGTSVIKTTGTTGALVTMVIGTFSTNTGNYVGIDANTFQVIFVDGQSGYIYDTKTLVFSQITDTGFPATPIDVCYLDGFFVVATGGTNNFQLSLFNQGLVWSGAMTTFTADTVTNILTLAISNANFSTGNPVTVSTTGTLPMPLATSTTYYVIQVGLPTTNPGTIKLASTYANAIANIPITLTSDGTPPNTIQISGQLQLGSITSHPGTIVACRTLHRRIFFFSQNFTEVWENAGKGTNLPFRRNNSLLMEVGTPAIGSISVGFDTMFFLAQDRDGLAGVMGVNGTNSTLASNRALDYQLAQYAADPTTGVGDARGILVKENGIIFYRLNFTAANHTYVFNLSMSTQDSPKWHEEEVLNGDRHPAQTHAYFDGVNYYGAYNSATFYIVDAQTSTNDGETIRRMRIGKQISPEGYNRLRIDRFQLDVVQGALGTGALGFVNPTTEIFSDIPVPVNAIPFAPPIVFLSVSKDGGQTYGNGLQATMGKIGDRTHRTVWRKIGTTPRGQGFVPKIEFFGQIPFVILGAAWDFEILPE